MTSTPLPKSNAPTNDDFDAVRAIGSFPFADQEDTILATIAADDPDMLAGTGVNSNTVWYRLVAPGSGSIRANTSGSDYDTVVAAFTGSRGSLALVGSNDDISPSTLQSEVVFNVQSGAVYFLEIAGYGDTGGGKLQLNVEYSSAAAETPTPEATAIPSPTPTATFGPYYWAVPNYTPQPTLEVGPPPSNDDIDSAMSIESLPFSSIINTTGATSASDDPGMEGIVGSIDRNSNTVWYRLVAPSTGSLTASTAGSDYDTVLAVFTGSRGNLIRVASNDDASPSVQSEVNFNVQAGITYYLEGAQYGVPAGGSLSLRVAWTRDLLAATPYGTPGIYGTPGVVGATGTMASSGGLASTPAPIRLAGPVQQDSRYFPQTGYRVNLDPIWDYFNKRGGVRTFGYPISWEFPLFGFRVQFFQRSILQVMPNGSIASMNLLDEGLMPYTRINFSNFPAPERDLTDAAPSPRDPNYGEKAIAFLRDNVPDQWEGMPVGFLSAFLSTVRYEDAFPNGDGDASLLPLMDLELWGLPTSRPARDPNNAGFVYQRFQRGILHYDAATGATQGLLLADYLKSIMTGRDLPADLEEQAGGGRFYRQYDPRKPGYLVRPSQLPGTNLEGAFESLATQPATAPSTAVAPNPAPVAAPITARTPTATATPTPKATPEVPR